MKKTALTALALLSLSACTINGDASFSNPLDKLNIMKEQSAKRIAGPVFMLPRVVKANEFAFQAYERVYESGQPTILYIGRNSNDSLLMSPESDNPLALKLASQDPKSNVIFLAQACQYVGNASDCPDEYTSNKRHAPEVIEAFDVALNNIRGVHNVTGFHIVGYDGGAGIGAALAAKREDVLSLRTVAGILDTQFYAHINDTEYSEESLNPVDIAPRLRNIPQHHFVGQLDREVTPALYHSFAQAVGRTKCLDVTIVPDATHEEHWVEQWSTLRTKSFSCDASKKRSAPAPFDPKTLDEMGGAKGLTK